MLISLIFIFRCLVTSLAGYVGNLLSTRGSKLTFTYYFNYNKEANTSELALKLNLKNATGTCLLYWSHYVSVIGQSCKYRLRYGMLETINNPK